jgi:hypothetical protein
MLPLVLLFAVQLTSKSADIKYRQPQVAVANGTVALTFGAGNTVYFSSSKDNGRSFSKPAEVSREGSLALGRHRGPRIAIAGNAIVISAVIGQKGRGQDGDLLAWRSSDGGNSWSQPVRINDVPASAREGLHAMASDGGRLVFATWLDLRSKGTKLYGAYSDNGGVTWSKNVLVYESPDGHICECCHPSAALDSKGRVYVMWRNWLAGSRDMYLARSDNGGETFGPAQKLGNGTWPLNACPMDGGGLALDPKGDGITVWRRKDAIFLARPETEETKLGDGKDAAVTVTQEGVYAIWTTAHGVVARAPGAKDPRVLSDSGGYPSLAGRDDVIAAWENDDGVSVERLR